MQVRQREHDWYIQTDKDPHINIREINENFGSIGCIVWIRLYESVNHVCLVRNVKKKLELSSVYGMTVINCLCRWANVVGSVHIKEPKLKKVFLYKKQLLLTMADWNDWMLLLLKQIWSCGTLILIRPKKVTLVSRNRPSEKIFITHPPA